MKFMLKKYDKKVCMLRTKFFLQVSKNSLVSNKFLETFITRPETISLFENIASTYFMIFYRSR